MTNVIEIPNPNPNAKKWKYLVLKADNKDGEIKLVEFLDFCGARGWELVLMQEPIFIFRQPLAPMIEIDTETSETAGPTFVAIKKALKND